MPNSCDTDDVSGIKQTLVEQRKGCCQPPGYQKRVPQSDVEMAGKVSVPALPLKFTLYSWRVMQLAGGPDAPMARV